MSRDDLGTLNTSNETAGRSDSTGRRALRLTGRATTVTLVVLFVWWLVDRSARIAQTAFNGDWSRWSVLAIAIVGVVVLLTLLVTELVDASARRRRRAASRERDLADEMKDGVLAAVAHNLREPAMAVHGHAKRLRDGRLHYSAAERNRLIENLADATEDLAATLDDLYVDVVTRLDRLVITPDAVELRPLLDVAMAKVGPRRTRSMSTTGAATAYIDPIYGAQILRSMVRIPASLGASTISFVIAEAGRQAEVVATDDAGPWPTAMREALDHGKTTSPTEGPLARAAGAAAELSRIMGGDLEYTRSDQSNRLRFVAPAADPSLRWAESSRPSAWLSDERLTVADVQRAIEEGPERIIFQPIVDLTDPSHVVGFEALSRFDAGGPSQWFNLASRAGLQLDLELACIRKAIWAARSLEQGFVAINLSSGLLASGGLIDALDGVDPKRVVIELSESSEIDRYETAAAAIAELTRDGFRLALDDVGNSEIDLWRIVRLRPAVVKLDLSLARRIDEDADRRAVAGAMISVAHAIDAAVVAEGIESKAELETMQSMGADLGQGFLFDAQVGTPPSS